jgi:hypothetical protein
MPLAFHICLKLANDAVIASTPEQRRLLARVVLERGREHGLLAFSQADNHVHMEAASRSREQAGKLAQATECSLHRRLGLEVGFVPALIKPIEDARHLYAVFRYILRQPERHRLVCDPLREASNLPDLLGLRPLGRSTTATVRQLLPRVQREELLAFYGIPDLQPANAPLSRLVEATLAAAALPSLGGSTAEVVEARRAAIEVVHGRLSLREIAAALRVSERTVLLLKHRTPNAQLVAAVRRQLHLAAQLEAARIESSPFIGGAEAA